MANGFIKLKSGTDVRGVASPILGRTVTLTEEATETIARAFATWLQKKTGKKLHFDIIANLDPLPEDLSSYKLAVQCGGCMVTRAQILNRVHRLARASVPVSNYGMAIAWCNGIFDRVTEIFRR